MQGAKLEHGSTVLCDKHDNLEFVRLLRFVEIVRVARTELSGVALKTEEKGMLTDVARRVRRILYTRRQITANVNRWAVTFSHVWQRLGKKKYRWRHMK